LTVAERFCDPSRVRFSVLSVQSLPDAVASDRTLDSNKARARLIDETVRELEALGFSANPLIVVGYPEVEILEAIEREHFGSNRSGVGQPQLDRQDAARERKHGCPTRISEFGVDGPRDRG
jgi:hypothetical protein